LISPDPAFRRFGSGEQGSQGGRSFAVRMRRPTGGKKPFGLNRGQRGTDPGLDAAGGDLIYFTGKNLRRWLPAGRSPSWRCSPAGAARNWQFPW
jgi:hypothetical protein